MAEKKTNKHEVIVVIVNEGYSDIIMDAAREVGARGGTILHARGTANKEMEKKYGVIITPSKEMLYILVNESIRDAVMSAVNKVAGIETKGQGIVFALPVSYVAGLKFE